MLIGDDTLSVNVIHQNDPRRNDFYDGTLWRRMGPGDGPLSPGWSLEAPPVLSPSGASYLVLVKRQQPAPGRLPMRADRFFADANSTQQRVQPGDWSDLQSLSYGGDAAPSLLITNDDTGKGQTGAIPIIASAQHDGLALDHYEMPGVNQSLCPLPPGMQAPPAGTPPTRWRAGATGPLPDW